MTTSRTRRRAGLSLAATLPLLAGALSLGAPGASAAPNGARHPIPNVKPAWAKPSADVGATAGASAVHARVYLAGRDPQGLASYAAAVSDPKSASYGHFLTPQQTQERYGASAAQQAAITSWLHSVGLTVTATTSRYLEVSGDASAVGKAFGTSLHNYRRGGKTYHAPASTVSVPSAVQGAVLTVTGLDNAPHRVSHQDTLPPQPAVYRNAGPMSDYYGQKTATSLPSAGGKKQPYVVKGYAGAELRAAYAKGSKYTGKGVTVAITDAFASPTIASDAAEHARRNGGAPYKKGQFTQVLPSAYTRVDECGGNGWYGEESLDVEAVHAVAPAANIVYVGAASCYDDDLLDSLGTIVDRRLADIVTNSWSDIEANSTPASAKAYDQVFMIGAVEGIGFYFSSGDDGDELASTGTKQIGTPANSAWATAVGGTSLAVGRNGTYQWETGWGTLKSSLSTDGKSWTPYPGDFLYGGGGGTSRIVAQPFYQRGIVPDSLAKAFGPTRARVIPDIAAVGDPTTGLLVGQTQQFPDGSFRYSEYRVGGTSLSSPVIAGVQALAQQARGRSIGFANPAIYARYGSPAYRDVTDTPRGGVDAGNVRIDYVNGFDGTDGYTSSLRSFGADSSLHAVRGYDDVTGVGTPTNTYINSFHQGRGSGR